MLYGETKNAMLESLLVFGVLGALGAVVSALLLLRRISICLDSLDHSLDSLRQFLFVRVPQPNPEELEKTKKAIISSVWVNLQNVSLTQPFDLTGASGLGEFREQNIIAMGSLGPIRRLTFECVVAAYKRAEEELDAKRPFDANSTERQLEINDLYLLYFRSLMSNGLSMVGGIVAPPSPSEGDEKFRRLGSDVKTGQAETRVGDVVIYECTETTAGVPGRSDDEFRKLLGRSPMFPVYFVRLITNEGPQPQGCFFTDAGAFEGAFRHLKEGGRILTQRDRECWWVTWENTRPRQSPSAGRS